MPGSFQCLFKYPWNINHFTFRHTFFSSYSFTSFWTIHKVWSKSIEEADSTLSRMYWVTFPLSLPYDITHSHNIVLSEHTTTAQHSYFSSHILISPGRITSSSRLVAPNQRYKGIRTTFGHVVWIWSWSSHFQSLILTKFEKMRHDADAKYPVANNEFASVRFAGKFNDCCAWYTHFCCSKEWVHGNSCKIIRAQTWLFRLNASLHSESEEDSDSPEYLLIWQRKVDGSEPIDGDGNVW